MFLALTWVEATIDMKIDAKPFAFEFALNGTALVIIDMQRDFIEPGGFGETLGNAVRHCPHLHYRACGLAQGGWACGPYPRST
jgi:hypothetical protein